MSQEDEDLGARHKAFEVAHDGPLLDPASPFIVRVDGHCFSTFTRIFKKPFDERITHAMVRACVDILDKFSAASSVYTFSDEISVVFPAAEPAPGAAEEDESAPARKLPYNGRPGKLASLIASFATARFGFHLARAKYGDSPEEIRRREAAEAMLAHFDGRAFSLPLAADVADNIVWRAADCSRNGVAGHARWVLGHRACKGKGSREMREMCAAAGRPYEESAAHFQFGTIVSREEFLKDAVNPVTGEAVQARRRRCVARSPPLGKMPLAELELLLLRFAKPVGESSQDAHVVDK